MKKVTVNLPTFSRNYLHRTEKIVSTRYPTHMDSTIMQISTNFELTEEENLDSVGLPLICLPRRDIQKSVIIREFYMRGWLRTNLVIHTHTHTHARTHKILSLPDSPSSTFTVTATTLLLGSDTATQRSIENESPSPRG